MIEGLGISMQLHLQFAVFTAQTDPFPVSVENVHGPEVHVLSNLKQLVSTSQTSRCASICVLVALFVSHLSCCAMTQETSAVRGVIPKAQRTIDVDGQLRDEEYRDAFCTPVEYFHEDIGNRPAQFFYLWDEDALHIGLRTLDRYAFAPKNKFWEGDAVEFYLDTRRRDRKIDSEWPRERFPGAVHCFFTAMTLRDVVPRFSLRPNYSLAIPNKGINVAARRGSGGLELEMRMPWLNFPEFKPRVGEVVHLDAELSYSDGGDRSFRTFAFGSPLSVPRPANLARLKLVNRLERDHWHDCGPVMMPVRIDEPWKQESMPLEVVGQIALPPLHTELIGKITFEVVDLHGNKLGKFDAAENTHLDVNRLFVRREATWPATLTAAGRYFAYAVVFDNQGKELTRIGPRLKSVNMSPGY